MSGKTFTSMTEFTSAAGDTDWKALDAARVANGEKCYRCGGSAMMLWGTGHRRLCPQCEKLDSDRDEVDHDSLVRCPHCRHTEDALDHSGLYEDGTHAVTCSDCGRDYEVETRVSYSFTSRPQED